MNNLQCRKAYVRVNLDVDEEGTIIPMLIRWKDGRVFQIEQLKYKCRASSNKVGITSTAGYKPAHSWHCSTETEYSVPSFSGREIAGGVDAACGSALSSASRIANSILDSRFSNTETSACICLQMISSSCFPSSGDGNLLTFARCV